VVNRQVVKDGEKVNMLWVVENWSKEASYLELEKALQETNLQYIMLRDFVKDEWTLPKFKQECVVFQGSIQMAKLMKSTMTHCSPVSWMTSENYLCSKYYSYFGSLLFNDRYAMATLKEVARNKFYFYGTLGKESSIFLRPDSGDKTFQAQLLDIQDLDRFVVENESEQHSLVLVSTPKNIKGEYRFIVSPKGIIAHSTYRYQGLITKIPAVPKGATQKCLEVINVGFHPDPVYCVDIAEDGDGNYWLLELNSFSSCGLYACDKKAIVNQVTEIAMDEYKKMLDKKPSVV
jgi:hypothetical protein